MFVDEPQGLKYDNTYPNDNASINHERYTFNDTNANQPVSIMQFRCGSCQWSIPATLHCSSIHIPYHIKIVCIISIYTTKETLPRTPLLPASHSHLIYSK